VTKMNYMNGSTKHIWKENNTIKYKNKHVQYKFYEIFLFIDHILYFVHNYVFKSNWTYKFWIYDWITNIIFGIFHIPVI